ncbi:hypothetical protein [Parasphingorhabdus sp.]|uniref:hypothetical protein n=1 Tax=Parasphingorhabdus sp. TaxID=2709688 RepID=UPI003266CE5A
MVIATLPELDLQELPDDLKPVGQLPSLATVVLLDWAKAAGTAKLEMISDDSAMA